MQPEGAIHLAFMFITSEGLEKLKLFPTSWLAGAFWACFLSNCLRRI